MLFDMVFYTASLEMRLSDARCMSHSNLDSLHRPIDLMVIYIDNIYINEMKKLSAAHQMS